MSYESNRMEKTAQMLIHKIEWIQVYDLLDLNEKTLLSWRKSNDANKHEAIDWAINQIINKKKVEK